MATCWPLPRYVPAISASRSHGDDGVVLRLLAAAPDELVARHGERRDVLSRCETAHLRVARQAPSQKDLVHGPISFPVGRNGPVPTLRTDGGSSCGGVGSPAPADGPGGGSRFGGTASAGRSFRRGRQSPTGTTDPSSGPLAGPYHRLHWASPATCDRRRAGGSAGGRLGTARAWIAGGRQRRDHPFRDAVRTDAAMTQAAGGASAIPSAPIGCHRLRLSRIRVPPRGCRTVPLCPRPRPTVDADGRDERARRPGP